MQDYPTTQAIQGQVMPETRTEVLDGYSNVQPGIRPEIVFKRRDYIRLKKLKWHGVQMSIKGGETYVSNPTTMQDNIAAIEEELIKIFYPEIKDPSELSAKKFDELYKPIDELDPLGLNEERQEAESKKDLALNSN